MAVTTGPFLNDIMQLAFVVDPAGDTTLEVNVRGGISTLHQAFVDNSGLASIVYLKFWDHVDPVNGTTDPDFVFLVPASTRVTFGFGPLGQNFTQGLSFGVSTVGGSGAGSAPATPPPVRLICT